MSHERRRGISNFPLTDIHVWDVQLSEPHYVKPDILTQFRYYSSAKDHVIESFDDLHQTNVETNDIFASCLKSAREFVSKELGYCSEGQIYCKPAQAGAAGEYSVYEDRIYVAPPIDVNEFHYKTIMTSLLIHEIAHESASVQRMYIFSETLKESEKSNIIRVAIGMAVMGMHANTQIRHGDFFEEAFAETVAARWRSASISGYSDNADSLLPTADGEYLPIKYSSPSHGLDEHGSLGVSTVHSAYAAYGIELLSDHSGVDLYELMKQARQPDTEVTAKREIIKTINSIQPGLYEKLRNLQYYGATGEFIEGLHLIKAAIAGNDTVA